MSTIPDMDEEQARLYAAMAGHHRFDEAEAFYTSAILQLRQRIGFASKILSKEERYRAFMIFGLLSVLRREAGEEGGMPSGVFSGYCTQVAGVSKRIAQSTLQLLVLYRFAHASVDPDDRRLRRFAATEMLLTYLEDWVGASAEALRRLGPWASVREPPRLLLPGLARFGGEAYARNGYMFFPDPDFCHVFAELEGGSLVVMAAIEAARAGRTGPSRGELRARFGLSRAQATRIVAAGRARALFGADASGATTVLPRLQALYRDCILRVLSFLLLQYERDRAARALEVEAAL